MEPVTLSIKYADEANREQWLLCKSTSDHVGHIQRLADQSSEIAISSKEERQGWQGKGTLDDQSGRKFGQKKGLERRNQIGPLGNIQQESMNSSGQLEVPKGEMKCDW